MEVQLYERMGALGLGDDRGQDLPVVGAVHLAAGYLLSEMFGCEIRVPRRRRAGGAPAHRDRLSEDSAAAFASPAFAWRRLR